MLSLLPVGPSSSVREIYVDGIVEFSLSAKWTWDHFLSKLGYASKRVARGERSVGEMSPKAPVRQPV